VRARSASRPCRAWLSALSAVVVFLLALIAGVVVGERAAAQAPVERQSFIVVMTDDQGAGMMRALPSVQRLLGGPGVTFENAFASYPLCCPSRATFLTGQYAHNHGAKGNTRGTGGAYQSLIDPERNLAAWLDTAGYDTAFVGKWLNGLRSPREPPPGWDEWTGLVGAGGEGLSSYYDFDVFAGPGKSRHFGSAAPDYQTDALTREYVLPFVAAHATDLDPFFLWLSLHPPHDGLGRLDAAGRRCSRGRPDERGGGQSAIPPPRYASRFTRARVPRPPSFDEGDLSDKPAFVARRDRIDERTLEKIDSGYRCGLAALLSVDDAIADIVAELRSAGRLESTTIVFTADQGFLAGEHRLRGKNLPYEEAIRVPLVVRSPGARAGTVNTEPVVNADLAPTILDLAGVGVPEELARVLDGVSLQAAMQGDESLARRAILLEGRKEAVPASRGLRVRSYVGVRTARYTYVEHRRARVADRAEGIELEIGAGRTTDLELYDLRRDPYQLQSRDGDPAYAAARRALAGLLGRLEHCAVADCAVTATVPRPRR
jgi:N-acetylglucosamine-6-sulfatase